jgi:hypothetical protein
LAGDVARTFPWGLEAGTVLLLTMLLVSVPVKMVAPAEAVAVPHGFVRACSARDGGARPAGRAEVSVAQLDVSFL